MINKAIAQLFYDMADMFEFLGVEWKPQAYRRGAQNILGLGKDLGAIYEEEGIRGLKAIPGIGEAMASKIEEYITTGKLKTYQKLRKKLPKGVVELMDVPGLGAKKAAILHKKLKVGTVAQLRKAIKQHKVAKLEGFGPKSEANILKGLDIFKRKGERVLMATVRPLADSMVARLQKVKGVTRVDLAGSMRRWRPTVKDIDILCISDSSKVIEAFCGMSNVKEVIAQGKTKASVFVEEGVEVDLRVVPKESYGAALNYFTGSKEHNISLRKIAIQKGLKLNEYGLFSKTRAVAGKTEKELYRKLGLPYIEPELREGHGELTTHQPKLVTLQDVKADLQMHTTFSDGNYSVADMAKAAKPLKYIAITDHYGRIPIANPVNKRRFAKYSKAIDEANKKLRGIMVLKGLEVDIDKEGNVECEPSILKQLDYCLAAVHRAFTMDKKAMTKRLCNAMDNEYVTALAHPTGKVVLERDPIVFDTKKVFAHAAKTQTALEINAHPSRTDLGASMIQEAIAHKVKLTMGTDSHSTEHLRYLEYGVRNARRGWAEKKHILNCLSLRQFMKAKK